MIKAKAEAEKEDKDAANDDDMEDILAGFFTVSLSFSHNLISCVSDSNRSLKKSPKTSSLKAWKPVSVDSPEPQMGLTPILVQNDKFY